ncbi:hypothetical protein PCE1_002779 [Barthelona sp. PCE]
MISPSNKTKRRKDWDSTTSNFEGYSPAEYKRIREERLFKNDEAMQTFKKRRKRIRPVNSPSVQEIIDNFKFPEEISKVSVEQISPSKKQIPFKTIEPVKAEVPKLMIEETTPTPTSAVYVDNNRSKKVDNTLQMKDLMNLMQRMEQRLESLEIMNSGLFKMVEQQDTLLKLILDNLISSKITQPVVTQVPTTPQKVIKNERKEDRHPVSKVLKSEKTKKTKIIINTPQIPKMDALNTAKRYGT